MAQSEFWLELIDGETAGGSPRRAAFSGKDAITLGRSSSSGLKLQGGDLAGEHARIFFRGGTFFIQNMSDVGTTVGEKRTPFGPLKDGDILRLGKSATIRFGTGAMPAAAGRATAEPPATIRGPATGATGATGAAESYGATTPPTRSRTADGIRSGGGAAAGPTGSDAAATGPVPAPEGAAIGAQAPARVTITALQPRRAAKTAAQFQKSAITLGSDERADFVLNDTEVAPVHARLSVVANLVMLEAAEGAEILVNDRAVKGRVHLTTGDTVRLGDEGPSVRIDFQGLAPGARAGATSEAPRDDEDEDAADQGGVMAWISAYWWLASPLFLTVVVAGIILAPPPVGPPATDFRLGRWGVDETIEFGIAVVGDRYFVNPAMSAAGDCAYVIPPGKSKDGRWVFDKDACRKGRRTAGSSKFKTKHCARAGDLCIASKDILEAPRQGTTAFYEALMMADEALAQCPDAATERAVDKAEAALRKALLSRAYFALAQAQSGSRQVALDTWREIMRIVPDPGNPICAFARHEGLELLQAGGVR